MTCPKARWTLELGLGFRFEVSGVYICVYTQICISLGCVLRLSQSIVARETAHSSAGVLCC